MRSDDLVELLINQPIFIGFKADNNLRQQLEALTDTNKQYVSAEDTGFLRICRVGEDVYVGKVIDEGLTTERVDDIRRNVLSIVRRLGSTLRLPTHLKIFACSLTDTKPLSTAAAFEPTRSIPGDPAPDAATR